MLCISTLTAGWCDKDHVLLHACFQLLSDFVEKEMADSWWVNWQQDEVHSSAKKEIDILYAWWKEWQIKVNNDRFLHEPTDYEKENEMLKRLIDVRKFLWT
jgi:hypothetical protein